jgi:transposase
MTKDDVLFGYRCQLFDHAARTSISEACQTFGVHRSTYYAWKGQVDRGGLEMLRPKERRAPQMPNQLSAVIEQRILAFSIAHPGFGPKRVASELSREKWGAIVVSPNGVYKVLRRHGLNTAKLRLALVAGYRAPYEPPREAPPVPHIEVERPGELVGIDCFKVGRLKGTNGDVWQLTAIDVYSSFAPRSWRPATPASAPGARRPTGTSSACTGRSSRSAGARPLPATSTFASPGCGETSTTTCAATTTTASTTAG